MVIPVRIVSVSEVKRGVSQTTGNAWSSVSVLLGFEDENGESFIQAQSDEQVWSAYNLRQGDTAQLNLKFRTARFRSGYVFNDIRIVPMPQNPQ